MTIIQRLEKRHHENEDKDIKCLEILILLQTVTGGESSPGPGQPSDTPMVVAVLSSLDRPKQELECDTLSSILR